MQRYREYRSQRDQRPSFSSHNNTPCNRAQATKNRIFISELENALFLATHNHILSMCAIQSAPAVRNARSTRAETTGRKDLFCQSGTLCTLFFRKPVTADSLLPRQLHGIKGVKVDLSRKEKSQRPIDTTTPPRNSLSLPPYSFLWLHIHALYPLY